MVFDLLSINFSLRTDLGLILDPPLSYLYHILGLAYKVMTFVYGPIALKSKCSNSEEL